MHAFKYNGAVAGGQVWYTKFLWKQRVKKFHTATAAATTTM